MAEEDESCGILKTLMHCIWTIVAVPFRLLLEGSLLTAPQQYMIQLLVDELFGVAAGLFTGLLIGAFFLCLASFPGLVPSGFVCSCYLTIFGYLLGCIVSCVAIRNEWYTPFQISTLLRSRRHHFKTPTEGGYVGTFIGLFTGYQVAASEAPVPAGSATTAPGWEEWCQPMQGVRVWIPIVIAFWTALGLGVVRTPVVHVLVRVREEEEAPYSANPLRGFVDDFGESSDEDTDAEFGRIPGRTGGLRRPPGSRRATVRGH